MGAGDLGEGVRRSRQSSRTHYEHDKPAHHNNETRGHEAKIPPEKSSEVHDRADGKKDDSGDHLIPKKGGRALAPGPVGRNLFRVEDLRPLRRRQGEELAAGRFQLDSAVVVRLGVGLGRHGIEKPPSRHVTAADKGVEN